MALRDSHCGRLQLTRRRSVLEMLDDRRVQLGQFYPFAFSNEKKNTRFEELENTAVINQTVRALLLLIINIGGWCS